MKRTIPYSPGQVLGTIAVLAVVGLLIWNKAPETRGQAPAGGKSAATAPREPDLMRDLDEAIRLVEKNEFQAFLVRFAPVEVLRKLRQQDLLERAATVMREQPQTKPRLLLVLNGLKKQAPRYDKSRGLATIDFDPLADQQTDVLLDLRIPDGSGLNLAGLGNDSSKVISEAIGILEAGDISRLVKVIFPATEVARLNDESQMKGLVQQFRDNPELPKAMIADFKRMQSVKPELADQGATALFRLAAEQEQPARTIKLQKVDGHWRLFDDSPRIAKELGRQSRLKPRGFATAVQFELVGGNWRFIEIPFIQMN